MEGDATEGKDVTGAIEEEMKTRCGERSEMRSRWTSGGIGERERESDRGRNGGMRI